MACHFAREFVRKPWDPKFHFWDRGCVLFFPCLLSSRPFFPHQLARTPRVPSWQTVPKTTFTEEERVKLTDRIQNGGTEVVEAKAGGG